MFPKNIDKNSSIKALLGPTNTGKTYYAMDRMLSHKSGIIGFHLRLLARENYEKAVIQVGKENVALVTGEEKIIPPFAKYFCCTVESMPLERSFSFVSIDEIQLAADPERGFIFTDRILNARGTEETVFLGAETIKPLLQKILPNCEVEIRPRLSTLSYIGVKKITRLKPRSAVVAFSVPEVYRIAELVRTKKGGAEIVKYLEKGSAFYAPAASGVQMAEAYLKDEKKLLPCAVQLNGEYGVKNVYAGVPVIVGKDGVEKIELIDLDEKEKKEFMHSIDAVKALWEAASKIDSDLSK